MKNNDTQLIASNLAQRAKSLNVTQSEIASAIGITQSQISRIFDGKIKRHSKVLDEIAKFLDVQPLGVTADAVLSNSELINALAATWNGTPAHSTALATVIRTLRVLNTTQA
jgi:transcriptional regulator with XRE-family HTH domain